MKKHLTLLLIFLGGFYFKSNAQPPTYDDLVILYADGDYEKLMKKSYKYTDSDDTRKDPLPYLFLSKGNYEVWRNGGELAEKYPRAYKEAIKYAGKCIQKDKEGTVYQDNLGYFVKLKVTVVEQLRNLAEASDWGRLMGTLPLMDKVDKEDIGAKYLKAAAQYYRSDKSGMKTTAKEAEELLANADPNHFTISEDDDVDLTDKKKIDLEMLKLGVIYYAQALVDSRRVDDAKKLMGQVAQWYPDDAEFKAKYDEIVN